VPYNQSVNKTDLLLKDIPWYDAVSAGIINNFVFGWYRNVQSYNFSDILEPAYGYWIYAYEPCEIWVENITITPDCYITDVEGGWNIVGVPYDQNVSKYDIIVNDILWDDAVATDIISDFVFGWSRTGQSYDFADTLMPGYAYWIFTV